MIKNNGYKIFFDEYYSELEDKIYNDIKDLLMKFVEANMYSAMDTWTATIEPVGISCGMYDSIIKRIDVNPIVIDINDGCGRIVTSYHITLRDNYDPEPEDDAMRLTFKINRY